MKKGRNAALIAASSLALIAAVPAHATIIGGAVTTGTGSFFKLVVPFAAPTPANTVGNDTFQNANLYGFDEDQNVAVSGTALNVDYLAATGAAGSLPVGTVVASHYVFFDPRNVTTQKGYVDFDSPILAIVSETGPLAASDYLANTGVTYLSPSERGLEAGDFATVDSVLGYRLRVNWTASTPGDYVRVLTAYSPAAVPEPETWATMLAGVGALATAARRRRSTAP